jgi:hypothetical protein
MPDTSPLDYLCLVSAPFIPAVVVRYVEFRNTKLENVGKQRKRLLCRALLNGEIIDPIVRENDPETIARLDRLENVFHSLKDADIATLVSLIRASLPIKRVKKLKRKSLKK